MFMMLMNGLAWVAVAAVVVIAFGLITGGLGAMIGNILAVMFRRPRT